MLMAGWGMQRQQYGEQKHWMLVTLAAMLGQIGTPGGGFGLSYHFANGGNPTRRAAVLGFDAGVAWQEAWTRWIKSRSRELSRRWRTRAAEYQHNGMDARISRIFALSGGRAAPTLPIIRTPTD